MHFFQKKILKELITGVNFFTAQNLEEYRNKFDTNSGRNGLITKVFGLYELEFIGNKKDLPIIEKGISICTKYPLIYSQYIQKGYSLTNTLNENEDFLICLDIKQFVQNDIIIPNFALKNKYLLRNPLIFYDRDTNLHSIRGYEPILNPSKVNLKLIVSN